MATRVLVTGGAGYLGAVLCEHLLAAGYHVTAYDNLMYRQHSLLSLCAHPRFHFERGDVRDAGQMAEVVRKADVLLNLAAIVGAPACDRDPWLAQSVNCNAVRLLTKLRSPWQLLIQPTTNSGYGARSGDLHCTEETPLEPISLYGQTKAQAETEAMAGTNVISLRLATVFGVSPRMRLDLLVNHFVYTAVTDRYLVLFEKEFVRNYVHIRDVADCFLHCIACADRMAGRVYNVGLDEANLTKAQLAEKIREYVPGFSIHSAEVGTDPDRRNYIVSNARLREAGFTARRTLDEGIRELLLACSMFGRAEMKNV